MAYHEMLPPEIIDFRNELKYWPMISAEMQQQRDFESALGACAARIGIMLDGLYDPLDLMRMLTKKLYEMRTTTIYAVDPALTEIRIKVGENEVVLENIPDPSVITSLLPSSKKEE